MGKWSNLPLDLLYVIEDYAALYMDKVRLRATRLEWSSHLPKLPDHRAKKIHFLLQPLENNIQEATHGLYNPLDEKTYKLYVPELNGKMAKGSFYGWIVATEEVDLGIDEVYLINPITRTQIKLPPRTEFADGSILCRSDNDDDNCRVLCIPQISSDYEFYPFSGKFVLNQYHMKIILSSDPDSDECLVIATFNQGKIAWCKFGDKNWTPVDTGEITFFVDILYSKNYLYALNNEGRVIMFENIGTGVETKLKEITADGLRIPIKTYAYFVECSDGSLIVAAHRFVHDACQGRAFFRTKEFKVYKYYSEPNSSWVEVKSIGDDVLFVGFGSVRSIPSADLEGFKKNHIYFCDFAKLASNRENKNVESRAGVFSLEDGTVETLQSLGCRRPVWTNIC